MYIISSFILYSFMYLIIYLSLNVFISILLNIHILFGPTELSTEGINLTCTATQMIVEIPTSLLTGGMTGNDVRFDTGPDDDNLDCRGKWKTDEKQIIELTTNLTACGTNMTVIFRLCIWVFYL